MEFWLVAGLAAFLMGLSKGGVPMLAMLSVPMLSLFMDPAVAAGLLLPIYIIADFYAVYLFRRAFSLKNLKILLPGATTGVFVAFLAVSHVPGDAIRLVVAGIGLSYLTGCLRNRVRKTDPPARAASVPRGLFWGTISGITSYIAHAGGPPYQAYMLPQRLEKMVYLGTTTIFFTIVNLLKLPPFILAGQVTRDSAIQAAWLVPFALLGAWSGAKVSRMLSERAFFVLIEISLGLVSLKLLHDVLIA